MESGFITSTLQDLWNAWNVRGFMILSLCMQLVLALAAPFRKKTSNGFAIFVVWSAYFLADWTAIFAFGLISNAGSRNFSNNLEVADDVMAFWAAFLLIHLGGPDTITAFSLEDNALWLRHLVGLVAQLFAFLYIFVKTLPHNRLLAPTILIFVAGVIKYGERTRALYLASLENLKKSIKKTADSDDQNDGEDDETHFPDEIRPAFHFHKVFKGLVVDVMPDFSEWKESREFFLPKDAEEVFNLLSLELKFLYEVFYTKIIAANSGWGVLTRSIGYCNVLVAFILFCMVKKDEFRVVDVVITYSLLAGVFALDTASIMMVGISDWTNTSNSLYFGLQIIGQGFFPLLVGLAFYFAVGFILQGSATDQLIARMWSEKMGSFNLLAYCFKDYPPRKCRKPGAVWEILAEMRHASKEPFEPELWRFVHQELKGKASDAVDADKVEKIYKARGDRALEEISCRELVQYITDYEYDDTLLLWHIATEIRYNIDDDIDNDDEMRRFSKILSDYMIYLLVRQPKMMSAVAGIGHVRYEHTCVEAKQLRKKFDAETMREFCTLILQEYSSATEPAVQVKHSVKSVLHDSCKLATSLRNKNNKWQITFKVWVELLSYAAGHCKADSHARLLCEGSEFITFVWLLLAHFGIGHHFPVN